MVGVNQETTIEWATNAVKDMRRLAARDRERVIDKIEQYAKNPSSMANQVITLTGGEFMRLRVGNYRVIFSIERNGAPTMVILRVRHRGNVYD